MSSAPHTSVRRDVEIQRKYYSDTASLYEAMQAHEGAVDPFSKDFVQSILRLFDVQSILDVGTATGRSLRDFRNALPGVFVCDVEPVAVLLQQGRAAGNLSDVGAL
jgi:SAM-dependent methyltransferase